MTTRLNDPGSPGLAHTLQALHRRFGPAGLIRPAAETGPPPPVIPTGFPTLDEALGLGGQVLRHYASIRLELRPVQALKARGAVVGSLIRATVRKNKLAPPFRQAEFEIRGGGTK